jgi:adenosine deaminase
MNENFEALPLSREEVMTLARNGFRAAFLDEATRQKYLRELESAAQ